MINIKEIENRKYDGKEPICFEYTIKNLEGHNGEEEELRIWFERINPEKYKVVINKPTYKVFTIIDSVVYEKIFQLPKEGIPLNVIIATGLNYLQLVFREEAAYKEMLSYTIGDIIKDM